MAKPLHERIKGAIGNPKARISDVEALVAEVTAERERQSAIYIDASAEAVNFALSDDERDEAAGRAEKAQRAAKAMADAATALEADLEARRSTERQEAIATRRARIIAERDAIAARLKAQWPALVEAVTDLLAEIERNDADMRAANMHDASAEAVARGIPGNFAWPYGAPIKRLTSIRLPSFDGKAEAWPRPAPARHVDDRGDYIRLRERQAEADKRELASWKLRRVTSNRDDRIRFEHRKIVGKGRQASTVVAPLWLDRGTCEAVIRDAEARRLRGLDGISVEDIAA